MNYTSIKKLPTMEKIVQLFELPFADHKQISQHREEIKKILEGHDKRILIIVGPCSAWPMPAVLEYAEKILGINEKLKDKFKIILRAYVQKPRTNKGWLGPAIQPDPLSYPDVESGLKYIRELMVKLVKLGLPIASEVLFTHGSKCFLELLSWAAIGARSSEDQEHRIFASALAYPVGMKNPTHGSLDTAVNSVIVAQHSHVGIFDGYEVQTQGNPHAHLVLRGANNAPNYSITNLMKVKSYMDLNEIKNPSIIIDASHDNCIFNDKREYQRQANVIFDCLKSLENYPDLRNFVKGFMIESFLKPGSQKVHPSSNEVELNGLSITDPCLGWEQTEELLTQLHKTISL